MSILTFSFFGTKSLKNKPKIKQKKKEVLRQEHKSYEILMHF